MFLTVQEMTLLCTFHAGSVAETLEMLRNAEDKRPEVMAVVKDLIVKMESLKNGERISLYFD